MKCFYDWCFLMYILKPCRKRQTFLFSKSFTILHACVSISLSQKKKSYPLTTLWKSTILPLYILHFRNTSKHFLHVQNQRVKQEAWKILSNFSFFIHFNFTLKGKITILGKKYPIVFFNILSSENISLSHVPSYFIWSVFHWRLT